MGKRYYCDYCDKTMVESPSVVKTHNKGLVHQRLVQEHYQKYKDVETILNEESKKKPCTRFQRGECSFGGICRFSHYTKEEINALTCFVASKYQKASDTLQPSFEHLYNKFQSEKSSLSEHANGNTVMYDSNGVTHIFPWSYNNALDVYGDDLPPSIKRFKISDLENARIVEWG